MTALAYNCLVKSTPHTGGTNNFAPCLNWSNWSFFSANQKKSKMIWLWGRLCPQMASTPLVLHFQEPLPRAQLTKGCIPPSKWVTWSVGTWGPLHGIHLDSCFWTVPSLLSPLFGTLTLRQKFGNKLRHIHHVALLTVTSCPSLQTMK